VPRVEQLRFLKEVVIVAELAEVEARIRVLEEEFRKLRDVEAIKKVKYRYWRYLDTKSLDELVDCFTEDAVADYGPDIKLPNRNAIVAFLKGAMPRFTGVHHGHNPQIELTSDTTAKGTWALYNYMIDNEANRGLRIGGFYYDEYVKEKGEWKISSTTEIDVFRDIWDRDS